MRACSQHDEYSSTCFGCYLSQPCDDCPSSAIYNGHSTIDGRRGKFCSGHTDFDQHCMSRDD